jgi:predicted acyl esterase
MIPIPLILVLVLGLPALAATASNAVSPPEYGMEMKEAWISMPDGVRLAADLYMPTGMSMAGGFQ